MMTKPTKDRAKRGVVYIELLIALPVFLTILYALFWIGLYVHQFITLRAALQNSLVTAITRGDPYLMGLSAEGYPDGEGLIPRFSQFRSGAGFEQVAPLLVSDNLPGSFNAEQLYNEWLGESYPGADLRDLPPHALYALAYTYEAVRMSIGSFVRFPCEPFPSEPLPDSVPHGKGCLKCRVLATWEMAAGVCPGPECAEGARGAGGVLVDRIGFECTLNGDVGFLQPLNRLIGASEQLGKVRVRDWKFLRVHLFGE